MKILQKMMKLSKGEEKLSGFEMIEVTTSQASSQCLVRSFLVK